MKLMLRALLKFLVGLVLVALLLLLPAGTVHYPGAWLFLALLFIPMLLLGVILLVRAPALLEKRLDVKENESAQKGVVAISAFLFLGGFVVAGLDFRYHWSDVPPAAVTVAAVVLLLSYGMYAEVMRENTYLSRTVEVQEGQKVIDTGLYGIIRHPMYTATVFLFLSIPVVLGSWWSLLLFAPYPFVIAARIINEEKILSQQLPGYTDYRKRVKYRLIPWIW